MNNWINQIGQSRHRRRLLVRGGVVAGATVAITVVSMKVRKERQRRIGKLKLAQDTLFAQNSSLRTVEDVICTLTRTSLQGTSLPGAKSVKDELDVIRSWHHHHGYKGGIVLRELTKPLFRLYNQSEEDMTAEKDAEEPPAFDITDPMRLARRECYYLYYELTDTGRLRQQIFCRGTTLSVDILTCLQTWWVFDEDLQCNVHSGFRNHADRMLHDILPLLAPPTAKRATIEIAGHSLGGAVAQILAIKLRRRGFEVVSVTSVAAPRYCAAEAVGRLLPLLPEDTLCIEDDRDPVPLLPPFGSPVGNKLWLVSSGPPRFIAAKDRAVLLWPDSIWWNFRVWELVSSLGQPHRIRNHVAKLKTIDKD